MPFVNEKIPEADILTLSTIVTLEKIRAIARWVPEFCAPDWTWTVDRDRNTYLISLVGGGREQLPYYVLGVEDQVVVFNVKSMSIGDDTVGIKAHKEVHDLRIPLNIEPQREEIKQLISKGLEEHTYFRPLANDGTKLNPNVTTRGNIISFNIEFK